MGINLLSAALPDAVTGNGKKNFLIHVASLSATKTGDALFDPKLVLSWLVSALGAPIWMIGLLVPIREAGALLPQSLLSGAVSRSRHRKVWWAAGSAVQGLAVLGVAAIALTMQGAAAGMAILACLSVFALARSACSVSYKDALARTVPKGARGTATGLAGSVAAAGALIFGMVLSLGVIEKTPETIAAALMLAGAFWMLACAMFLRLDEPAADPDSGGTGLVGQFRYLWEDPQLGRFVLVRGLLTVTALAPPYIAAMGSEQGEFGFSALGPLVLASAAAALTSGYVWGRFSDLSSKRTLQAAAVASAVFLGLAAGLKAAGFGGSVWIAPALLYFAMVAYQGVRTGRSTHLTDMAPEDRRAAYTAVSNTAIGVILLVGGGFGFLAGAFGVAAALALFAALCVLAAALAQGLEDVQR